MKLKALLPLTLFLLLAVFLAIGLTRNPRDIPSPLINKAAPDFQLAQLQAPSKTLNLADMRGKIWLLNVWASWCTGCREEHPTLLAFAEKKRAPIIGLNYKDQREAALDWLQKEGNPYTLSISDSDGKTGINYGVYGVPETFLIDAQGRIRYKHTGPVDAAALATLEQHIRALETES